MFKLLRPRYTPHTRWDVVIFGPQAVVSFYHAVNVTNSESEQESHAYLRRNNSASKH